MIHLTQLQYDTMAGKAVLADRLTVLLSTTQQHLDGAVAALVECRKVHHADCLLGIQIRAAIDMARSGHAPLPQGFQRCAHVAPRPESGTHRYTYTLNGIGLECDIEFDPEDGDGWNEPREPATATLCKAWVRDVDVYELLDDDQVAEIEEAFMAQDGSDE